MLAVFQNNSKAFIPTLPAIIALTLKKQGVSAQRPKKSKKPPKGWFFYYFPADSKAISSSSERVIASPFIFSRRCARVAEKSGMTRGYPDKR